MACKRCPTHLINYPGNHNRCLVPGCYEDLDWFPTIKHDEDYEEQAASFAAMLDDNDADTFQLAVNVHYHPDVMHLLPLAIPDCHAAEVTEFKGLTWIGHMALLRAGYVNMESFDVVMVNGKFYELQGRAHPERSSGPIAGGVWWLEEVNPDNFRFTETFEEVIEKWQRS